MGFSLYEIGPMKIALIVNPCSGGKNGKKYLPRVIQKLAGHGIKYDTVRYLT